MVFSFLKNLYFPYAELHNQNAMTNFVQQMAGSLHLFLQGGAWGFLSFHLQRGLYRMFGGRCTIMPNLGPKNGIISKVFQVQLIAVVQSALYDSWWLRKKEVVYSQISLYRLKTCIICCSTRSPVWFFVTPWTAARQASLASIISWSLLRFMSIESVMLSNYLILCRSLLWPSVFPSIRVFSSESALHIRWPKYWNFSFSASSSRVDFV